MQKYGPALPARKLCSNMPLLTVDHAKSLNYVQYPPFQQKQIQERRPDARGYSPYVTNAKMPPVLKIFTQIAARPSRAANSTPTNLASTEEVFRAAFPNITVRCFTPGFLLAADVLPRHRRSSGSIFRSPGRRCSRLHRISLM
jgi:hypothetical protein